MKKMFQCINNNDKNSTNVVGMTQRVVTGVLLSGGGSEWVPGSHRNPWMWHPLEPPGIWHPLAPPGIWHPLAPPGIWYPLAPPGMWHPLAPPGIPLLC